MHPFNAYCSVLTLGFHAGPNFRRTITSPAEGFTFSICLLPREWKWAALVTLHISLAAHLPWNANPGWNNVGQQLRKNTVGRNLLMWYSEKPPAALRPIIKICWPILALNTLTVIFQRLDKHVWDSFMTWIWFFFFFLVGRLTLMNGNMTHRQNHGGRQKHLHLEFNLDAFYLHHSQHRVNGLQKAPVDLVKTTFSTHCGAYDPEAVHFEQCCLSLLRTRATNIRTL